MFKVGQQVKSLRDERIVGEVIGFGALQWHSDETPDLVYLVRVREEGSSSLGSAVVVLQADQITGA